MTKISVVMKCLDGAETIAEALQSLAEQRAPFAWEVILADNGSTDGTREIFADWARQHPQIPARLVDASAHRGKSNALNIGIRAAASDHLVFLDADDTLAPGYLVAMEAALASEDFVASRLDIWGLNPGWMSKIRKNRQIEGLSVLSHAPHCTHAGGATLGFHRRVFEAVGGFDPRMTCLEDTDFCIRAHQAGFRLTSVPEAVYRYRYRSTPRAIQAQAAEYAEARALLRQRYADPVPFLTPGRWLRLFGGLAGLGASSAKHKLLRRTRSPEAEAAHRRRLGRATGDLRASLRLRVAPAPDHSSPVGRILAAPFLRLYQKIENVLRGSIVSVRTKDRLMALTFDDGPDPETTPRVLDALAEARAKATFFVIGERAARYPDLLARIAAEGHEIGNHTWDHPSLPTLPPGRITDQIARTKSRLAPLGQALMRPPYGDQTRKVQSVARKLGYAVVLWSISSGDWRGEDGATVSARIAEAARPGAIVLMHDALYTYEAETARDRSPTVEAVTRLADLLPDYRFVTVSNLIASGSPVRIARYKTTDAADLAALHPASREPAPDPGMQRLG